MMPFTRSLLFYYLKSLSSYFLFFLHSHVVLHASQSHTLFLSKEFNYLNLRSNLLINILSIEPYCHHPWTVPVKRKSENAIELMIHFHFFASFMYSLIYLVGFLSIVRCIFHVVGPGGSIGWGFCEMEGEHASHANSNTQLH